MHLRMEGSIVAHRLYNEYVIMGEKHITYQLGRTPEPMLRHMHRIKELLTFEQEH